MRIPKLDIQMYVCNQIISCLPSHTMRLAFYRNVMGYKIGTDSYVFMGAFFFSPSNLEVGDNSVINQGCLIDTRGKIMVGNKVSISAGVALLTADHDPNSVDFSGRTRSIVIEDYVFIGTRAMVLPGVKIGTGGVVGAGSVVTKDVEPYTVVVGAPARQVSERRRDLDYTISYGRWFW